MESKIIRIFERLENPKYPLLGPNLKGLYCFGLWQRGNRIRNGFFNFVHFWSFIFVISQFIELYYTRNDLMKVLFNISVTALSLVSISKTVCFIFYLPHWQKLVKNISAEEIRQFKNNDPKLVEIIRKYKMYSRIITFLFWSVILLTYIIINSSPFLKYATSSSYRESIQNGTEPYPQILSSWFPFDKTKMPGYLVSDSVHILMTTQGTGVIAVYDASAVTIMMFLKAQMTILNYNCEKIFGYAEAIPRDKVLDNIKECHRLHNFFLEQYKIFNSIISPVMFIYVLVCSIMNCCSVVQLNISNFEQLNSLIRRVEATSTTRKMVLTLYGMYASPPVRAVKTVINKLNLLNVEYVNVNILKNEQNRANYLKMNPQHSIPTLKDDGFIIWDSHAITTYLVSKYAKDDSLNPTEPKQRAIIDQRLHFDSGVLFPAFRQYVMPLIFGGSKSNHKNFLDNISVAYDLTEKFLTRQWLAGDILTLADICCYATISSLNVLLPIKPDQFPNLAAWLQRCSEQGFIKKANEEGLVLLSDLINSKHA